MVADGPKTPAAELDLLEEEIAELERGTTELRRRIGERTEYPTDPAEVSLLLTEAEEQEAILASLKERRDALKDRLGQP
ncbi:hypothetical protein [Actinoplanes siamensis]|uniref:Uncharacterized protein n=1 Tax=Actinoplanes siamensis TaxID=1223317 RepID=A0A919TLR8_9ACTN|nr:hypothetical protein [Actinoplanes siamensis]GIF06533.1 hypothetical protein Asi03nite_40710 [Actinoplanes siamensis]